MATLQVLCAQRFTEPLLDELRAVSPLLEVLQVTCHNREQVAAALAEHPSTQVLYTFPVPADALRLAPGLRWIQLHTAGADHLAGHPILSSPVAVTTTSGIHATPIAEYVMASILAHRWQVPLWADYQREHRWPSGRWGLFSRPELRGSTLGIVGYGSIGREVARLGQTFGMRVLACRRSASRAEQGYAVEGTGDPQGAIPERFFPIESLRELLAESDYVVLSVPSTPATFHLIDEAALRAMKPSAFLFNISRGVIVDEAALVRALGEGWIAGAGLDVYEQEPLPPESALWEMKNALLSPHVAGFSPHYDRRAVALFAQNLRRYLVGEPLLNLVDPSRGY